MYSIIKYKNTRFWAVMQGTRLVTICVYKKGAQAVIEELEEKNEDDS